MSKTIQFDLNQPVIDEEGEPIRLLEKIQENPKFKGMDRNALQTELAKMTDLQVKEFAPIKTVGILLREILSRHVDAGKDVELSVEIFEYIQRINNKINNTKGIWEIDQKETQKLLELLKKTTGGLKPLQLGQLISIIKEKDAELTLAKKD